MRGFRAVAAVVVVAAGCLCSAGVAWGGSVVFSASGTNTAAIQATVDSFRSALGALNPNVAGSFGSGRREINWDGVPDPFAAPNNLPANFFNVNSPRGVVLSTSGTGFQVSANAASGTPVEFGNIDPSYPLDFAPFSPQRLFTALGSVTTDVTFFVPGSSVAAGVTGFGAVFSDIDVANVTSIQFFNATNNSLGTFFAPSLSGSETFSFLGVLFNAGERIARVRVTSGNQVLAPGNISSDLVVLDDFIYGEPVGTPTVATLLRASARRSALGVRVRWQMANGIGLAGFNVFRRDGRRLLRLNERLVAASVGEPTASGRYRWLDKAAPQGTRLLYRLQAVHLDGSRTWLGSAIVRR
jgi:hypothetical protein